MVVIEGTSSETTSIDSGVPQGTVLGPLPFLCHINDLLSSVKSLYREIDTQDDHNTLQSGLKRLEKWAETWGRRFNATKCYILSLQNKTNFYYQLNNVILKRVPTNPYLGLQISEDL